MGQVALEVNLGVFGKDVVVCFKLTDNILQFSDSDTAFLLYHASIRDSVTLDFYHQLISVASDIHVFELEGKRRKGFLVRVEKVLEPIDPAMLTTGRLKKLLVSYSEQFSVSEKWMDVPKVKEYVLSEWHDLLDWCKRPRTIDQMKNELFIELDWHMVGFLEHHLEEFSYSELQIVPELNLTQVFQSVDRAHSFVPLPFSATLLPYELILGQLVKDLLTVSDKYSIRDLEDLFAPLVNTQRLSVFMDFVLLKELKSIVQDSSKLGPFHKEQVKKYLGSKRVIYWMNTLV